MAHVIPTLRTAMCPTYTAPVMRRKSDLPVNTRNPASATDFGTILNNQSPRPVTAPAAAAPAAAAPASPSGTIGSVTPWSPTAAVVPAAPSTCPLAPTAQSLFGANPWSTDAGGTGPAGSYGYNPYYFATPATAAKVAQMLGGKVVAMDAITPLGPFQQNQPNQMIQMPDGRLINAGLVAGFYDHGYTQQTVDKMIAAEVSGNTMYS
jgi:hypothetical protein